MDQLTIYRSSAVFITIPLSKENTFTQQKEMMGANSLALSFTLSFYAEFRLGDRCTVYGETYLLSEPPIDKKLARNRYEYSLKFNAEGQDLAKVQYLFLDAANSLTEPDFSLRETALGFVKQIVANANRAEPNEWEVGSVAVTDYKNLSFSKVSCLTALSQITEAFSLEYWIIGKTVHLTKIAVDRGYLFRYGKHQGLYDIQRQPLSGSSVITRLFAFGSDKNLPPGYKSKRLHLPDDNDPCLPTNITVSFSDVGPFASFIFNFSPAPGSGITGLQILYRHKGTSLWTESATKPNSPGWQVLVQGGYQYEFKLRTEGGPCAGSETGIIDGHIPTVQYPDQPTPSLQRNVGLYGLAEWTEYFDDVFPRRTGKVTGVDATNVYQFFDTTMDFDLNAYGLAGTNPKVTFNTGQLAGYTFDVAKYDAGTKLFTILKNKDERALDVPSEALRPQIGDEYVITDIQMPQSYVIQAEQALLSKAQEFLNRVSEPQFTYTVTVDPLFLKRSGWQLAIGALVRLQDDDLNIDRKIRIVSTTRSLVNEYEYQIQLADTVTRGTLAQLQVQGAGNAQGIQVLQAQLTNGATFNNRPVGDWIIQQGTVVAKDIEKVNDATGLLPLYLDPVSGKFVAKA